jgi:V8-like Glu-specific endopeptidase
MVVLERADRASLLAILRDMPELTSERGRRQTLIDAGLDRLAAQIDVSGAPAIALGEVVDHLARYGRPTADAEALGLLLNWVKSLLGVEKQAVLAGLMTRYDMMVPLAQLPSVVTWLTRAQPAEILEKIVGENTLRPIAFLEQGLHVARSVAYVGLRSGSGTGFLVAPDLLLTNHHVIPDREASEGAVFRFNFQSDWRGEARKPAEHRARLGGVFVTDEALDYSLIEVDETPGAAWGWLPLKGAPIRRDDRVNIIQHAGGQQKQVSFQNNLVVHVGGGVAQYVTSTLPGSSGAPVFDDHWEVVAIHHAGGALIEAKPESRHFRNEGILIAPILQSLPTELKARLAAAGAG